MKTQKINLGYLQISDWTPKDPLFPDWMKEEDCRADYAEGIEENQPNDIVLSEGVYQLKITYPLENPSVTRLEVNKKGITRKDLAAQICKIYRQIYKEEDESAGHKTGNIPGMLNRATSAGKYGIWGHNLTDLTLHGAEVKNNVITVGVDS